MTKNKLYQGFLSLDNKDFATEEEKAEYYNTITSFFIEFTFINQVNNRQLYLGVTRKPELLEDQYDEETQTTTEGFLSFVADRFPVVLGMFNMDGTEYGTTRVLTQEATYDEETGEILTEPVYHIEGTPIYHFKSSKYLALMPDEVTTDPETGEEISRTRPTSPYPLRSFSGFKLPVFPN